MSRPNFFVIGQIRGGTTFLYSLLINHPEVFLNPYLKESRFFVHDFTDSYHRNSDSQRRRPTNVQEYEALFKGATDLQTAIGDISPQYLQSRPAAQQIFDYAPNAKIIATLRNPADRIYSTYHLGEDHEHTGSAFLDYFRAGLDPRLVRRGFMFENCNRYCEIFPKDQLLFLKFEDLINYSEVTKHEVCRHLGIDSNSFPEKIAEAKNESGIETNKQVGNFFRRAQRSVLLKRFAPEYLKNIGRKIRSSNRTKPEKLSGEARHYILKHYQEDTLKLQDLLNLDLSGWLAK